MDSIQLLEKSIGHFGKPCKVKVTTGDTYCGIYHGFCESFSDNPLIIRLGITNEEAMRIGVFPLSEIGVCYDVIVSINF